MRQNNNATTDSAYTDEFPANRKIKDTLFRKLFCEKTALLELYNAVNGSHYTNPEDLEITTLDNVIYMTMKNDLSFLISQEMNLYEHQSTVNPNLPLRGVFYMATLLRKYVKQRDLDIYGSARLIIPYPRYIVFYNGETEIDERIELKLSDNREEVRLMILEEYDPEFHIQKEKELSYREGEKNGLDKGIKEGSIQTLIVSCASLIQNLHLTTDEAISYCAVPEDYISPVKKGLSEKSELQEI